MKLRNNLSTVLCCYLSLISCSKDKEEPARIPFLEVNGLLVVIQIQMIGRTLPSNLHQKRKV